MANIQSLTEWIWYLPFVAVACAALFRLALPRIKGWVGEKLVSRVLRRSLAQPAYHLMEDVTLPLANDTTQIDHVVVSIYGVFVIETKNMKGWIFGSERQAMWTQKIYKHSQRFQNPLRQNYKHVVAVRELLGLAEAEVHSVVVFVGSSTFKTPMPENVVQGGKALVGYLQSKSEELFTPSEAAKLVAQIEAAQLEPSFQARKTHIENVKKTAANKPPSCPKCGSTMVVRQAKRGANAGKRFWGCSRYPSCRGTAVFKGEMD